VLRRRILQAVDRPSESPTAALLLICRTEAT